METITSRKNAQILQLFSLLRDAALRDESGLFAVEGVKLCAEAITAGMVSELFITQQCLDKHPELAVVNYKLVMPHVYERITMLKSPEGVCALCTTQKTTAELKAGGRYLVLYDIQNPDNAGAMIRTAAALCYDGVISCGGVSLTSPKLIRAAAGATFVIPTIKAEPKTIFSMLQQADLRTVATSPSGRTPLSDCNISGGGAIFIGNEGGGLPQDIIDGCSDAVRIEIGGFESLNAAVAAGIIMYHLRNKGEINV